uniref:FLYWCH-type domain-containing protein n=1 Tax=Cuerna arida TaxID=1464854 RepID=A0A1B6G1B5_9HEMI
MEPVISDRGMLHIYDGHLYTTTRIHNSATVYSRCRIPSCNSRATFIVDKPNEVHVTIPHNHEADEVEVEILRFKAELKRRAVVDSRSPRELFDDVSQQYL